MAFFSAVMLEISLELATTNINPQTYKDVALKFLDHFISLCDTINSVGGKDNGLWNEEEGFYYDHVRLGYSEMYFHLYCRTTVEFERLPIMQKLKSVSSFGNLMCHELMTCILAIFLMALCKRDSTVLIFL